MKEYKSVRISGKVKSIYVRSLGAVTLLWKIASEPGYINIIGFKGLFKETVEVDFNM